MSRAVLSIGSNLGDRLAHLRSVADAFAPQLVAVSSVYSTVPWGTVPPVGTHGTAPPCAVGTLDAGTLDAMAQPDFLNAVLVVDDPAANPRDWLVAGHRLEQAAGRVRQQRWGARTLDVDVVCCYQRRPGGRALVRSADPELTLPHPRAHERPFVLIPWVEVEPDAALVVLGRLRPIHALVAAFPPEQRAEVEVTELTLQPGRSVATGESGPAGP